MRDVARGEKAVAAGLKVGRGLGGWELAQLNWSKLFKRGLLLKKSIIVLPAEKRRPRTGCEKPNQNFHSLNPQFLRSVTILCLFAGIQCCQKDDKMANDKATWKLIARLSILRIIQKQTENITKIISFDFTCERNVLLRFYYGDLICFSTFL